MELRESMRVAERYDLERLLGQGVGGATWKARDSRSGQFVTLKLQGDSSLLQSIRREFGILRGLAHPNLPRVKDLGVLDWEGHRTHYLAAQFIEGTTLLEAAAGRTWDSFRPAFIDLLVALDALHRAGLRHGDVKPANVIVRPDGSAVLIDLGLAQPMEETTIAGGTPRFMAPELHSGQVGASTDLYALGISLGDACDRLVRVPGEALELRDWLSASDPSRRPVDASEVLESMGEPRASVPAVRRLVGRDRELRSIDRALDDFHAGRPGVRVVWIHGLPGLGRSRLSREAKWSAQVRGRVVEGFAHQAGCMLELLRRVTGDGNLQPGVVSALDCSAPAPTVAVLDDPECLDVEQAAVLRAVLRTAHDAGTIFWVIAAGGPSPVEGPHVRQLDLRPLTIADVAAWTDGQLDPARSEELWRLTGGYPASLQRYWEEAQRSNDAWDLEALTQRLEAGTGMQERFAALGDADREALAFVALGRGRVPIDQLPVSLSSMVRLEALGWVQLDDAHPRLVRPGEADQLIERLPPLQRSALCDQLAAACMPGPDPTDGSSSARVALGVELLSSVSEERANALARAHVGLASHAPAAWLRALSSLEQLGDLGLRASELALELDRAEQALSLLARIALPSRRLDLTRARALTVLGRTQDALQVVETGREAGRLDLSDPEVAEVIARIAIRAGDRLRAAEVAEAALRSPGTTKTLRARLLEARGVAQSYLGEHQAAAAAFRHSRAISQDRSLRERFRLATYMGIDAYRQGRVGDAIDAYADALALAEQAALGSSVAGAALNLGSALHQAGELGAALRAYERGVRLARALQQASTRLTLELNLGKLYSDMGFYDRAERMLEQVELASSTLELWFLWAAAKSIRGENHSRAGRSGTTDFEAAKKKFEELGAAREVVEVQLQQARAEIQEGAHVAAAARVAQLAPRVEMLGARDIRVRWMLLQARLDGRRTHALESALELARDSEQRLLEAEVHEDLARVWRGLGGEQLAVQHGQAAQVLRERCALELPTALRDRFLSLHAPSIANSPTGMDPWRRLVSAIARLNDDLHLDRVLERAMDAAIELTGAERGFVILAQPDGGLEVAAARSVDRERIAKSYLKFSRTIAERVIAEAEPIVSTDALSDDRFQHEMSVQGMKLRSVLAAPIPGRERVLGAIYLDNRFERDCFGRTQQELVTALANQVALAVRNAMLVEALEEERAKTNEQLALQTARVDQLTERLTAEQHQLRFEYGEIVGRSAAMRTVLRLLDKVTDTNVNVLIQGESGTGKDVVARSLHDNGPRKERPFVSLNCGALPDSLIESELFGHVKGAFTGATRDQPGLFVSADGGTLFLDEVGEMSPAVQVRLLRALQERRVRPVGARSETEIDVRLVAATNRDLRREVERGRFREDLFYRINVVEIWLPPLRERLDDLPLLVEHFLEKLAKQRHVPTPSIDSGALRALASHPWPGNVRELLNVLERAFVMAASDRLLARDIVLPRTRRRAASKSERGLERKRILEALEEFEWNVAEVSRALGIPRSSLYRKLRRYDIRRPT